LESNKNYEEKLGREEEQKAKRAKEFLSFFLATKRERERVKNRAKLFRSPPTQNL
jgi:hypothetical protein